MLRRSRLPRREGGWKPPGSSEPVPNRFRKGSEKEPKRNQSGTEPELHDGTENCRFARRRAGRRLSFRDSAAAPTNHVSGFTVFHFCSRRRMGELSSSPSLTTMWGDGIPVEPAVWVEGRARFCRRLCLPITPADTHRFPRYSCMKGRRNSTTMHTGAEPVLRFSRALHPYSSSQHSAVGSSSSG